MSGGHFGTDPSRAGEPMAPMDPQGRRGYVGRRRALAFAAALAVAAGGAVLFIALTSGSSVLVVSEEGLPAAVVREGARVQVQGELRAPAVVAAERIGRAAGEADERVLSVEALAGSELPLGEQVTVAGEVGERVGPRAFTLVED